MSLVDAAYVRQVGHLSDKVEDLDIAPHLAAAGLRLVRWVGSAAYADAGQASPTDATRATALKLAEARLTLAELFTALGGNFSNEGFVGGASLSEGQASYLTPGQVEKLIEQHLAAAERMAGSYLLAVTPPAGVVVTLEDEDDSS